MREHMVRVPRSRSTVRLDQGPGSREGGVQIERETVPARLAARGTPPSRRPGIRKAGRARFGSAVRIGFGLIWLVDAYFKWQPSFLTGLLGVVRDGAAGQPAWLEPWFSLVHAILVVQPTLWAYLIALVETGIAVALIFGIARKVTYLGGALWSLLIWTTAEGFGRTPSGQVATDVGTAIAYAAVFLALLAADQCAGTRSLSLDAAVERRAAWWRRLAEVRR